MSASWPPTPGGEVPVQHLAQHVGAHLTGERALHANAFEGRLHRVERGAHHERDPETQHDRGHRQQYLGMPDREGARSDYQQRKAAAPATSIQGRACTNTARRGNGTQQPPHPLGNRDQHPAREVASQDLSMDHHPGLPQSVSGDRDASSSRSITFTGSGQRSVAPPMLPISTMRPRTSPLELRDVAGFAASA
jgi:hypothetical protein